MAMRAHNCPHEFFGYSLIGKNSRSILYKISKKQKQVESFGFLKVPNWANSKIAELPNLKDTYLPSIPLYPYSDDSKFYWSVRSGI